MAMNVEVKEIIKGSVNNTIKDLGIKSEGFYILDDGTIYTLMYVGGNELKTKDFVPYGIAIPRDIVLGDIKAQAARNILDDVEQKLNHITRVLEELPETQHSSGTDLSDIAQLIAITLKPELIKEM